MNSTHIISDSLFSDFKMIPQIKICIVIPVKNEEAYILKTLQAFSDQVDEKGSTLNPNKFEILLLANNCSDNSVKYIKDFQRLNPTLNIHLKEIVLAPHQANIGYVRRKLMDAAYSRLSEDNGGVIMTTDGDTIVATDWITNNLLEIANGSDAVGGRIMLLKEELAGMDRKTYYYHLKDETYHLLVAELESQILDSTHDPAPRHHQHFHGSFAVTTECYVRAGGIPDVTYLEDCAFFENLQAVDAKVRHSNKVVVHTSARYDGRAEVGLSFQLNHWKNFSDVNNKYWVESCASLVGKLTLKRKLMNIWESRNNFGFDFYREIEKLKPGVIITPGLYLSFQNSEFFGAWYSSVFKALTADLDVLYPKVLIEEAIEDLKCAIDNYSNANFSHTSIR